MQKLFHRLVGCLTNGRYTILKRTIRYSGCRVAPTKSADRRRAKGRKKWQKHERLRKRNGRMNERLNAANGNAKMIITREEVSRKLQYNFVLESFHFYFSIFCSFRLNEFRHSKQSRTYIHRTKSWCDKAHFGSRETIVMTWHNGIMPWYPIVAMLKMANCIEWFENGNSRCLEFGMWTDQHGKHFLPFCADFHFNEGNFNRK